jgi:hypothetical protein
MGSSVYSFSGQLDAAGIGTKTIHRTRTNALTLTFQVDALDYNRITGTVGDGTWLADLQAERRPFGAGNHTLSAGKYTLVFPGPGDGSALTPQGDGYGAVTVDPSGLIHLNGALGDGTSLTKTVNLVADGQWPFYASLYGGKGQIMGWLTFTNSDGLGGTTSWIKLPVPKSKFYPLGFNLQPNAIGSAYQPPSASVPRMLPFTNAVLVLTGGNLAVPITNSVTIGPRNKVVDTTLVHKLTLTLGPSLGTFKGSLINPATGKRFAVNGAILQNQEAGSGCFSGTNQFGQVILVP